VKPLARLAYAAALVLPLLLSGCSLLPSTRKLPVPKAPARIQTVTPEELVAQLNQRWNALQTLNATVDIQLTALKTTEGIATDYPTIRGHILMRKPELLRVLGLVPLLGTRAFDMASDGKEVTLVIPSKSKAFKGSATVKKKSDNKLENIRPGVFFDALVVRGLGPEDSYSVTANTVTIEDAAKKHLFSEPEYVLSITRHTPGTQKETPVRVVRFHRDDLLPYQQDVYDSKGNLETQVTYAAYQSFEGGTYPSAITVVRPLDEYQIVLSVEKVVENMTLPDDQFQVEIPAGTAVENLD
jgi:outer membrane lipoprotein-sorting protein